MPTITCKNCGKEKPANPRLKGNQKYCGDPLCQRARKREWHRNKMATDPEYRASQRESLKKWRKNRPADQYQRQYRESHPDYVSKNREQQRQRNKKRSREEKIVKMDALTSDKLGHYCIITPVEIDASTMIVKMDPFLAQLIVLPENSYRILPAIQ